MPVSGAWRVSYDLTSLVHSGEVNRVFVHLNDKKLWRTEHHTTSTYKSDGRVSSTGGRDWTFDASVGDTFYLKATNMDGKFEFINFCAQFIPKI